jgi:hypothetical protein
MCETLPDFCGKPARFPRVGPRSAPPPSVRVSLLPAPPFPPPGALPRTFGAPTAAPPRSERHVAAKRFADHGYVRKSLPLWPFDTEDEINGNTGQ